MEKKTVGMSVVSLVVMMALTSVASLVDSWVVGLADLLVAMTAYAMVVRSVA